MSNYTKATNFLAKDSLAPGDPLKIVRGSEIDAEFEAIASAVATKVDSSDTPFSFRNKLINGNFAINQRGYVSDAAVGAANTYTLDRWRVVVSGQSLTYTSSGNGRQVTAPAGGIEQVIEAINIEGGVYTLSWTGTATATVNGAAVSNGGQTTSLPANTAVTIRFSGGTVEEVQFETGSVATPFEQRPHGLELSLCRRYFLKPNGDYIGFVNDANSINILIPHPVEMRISAKAVSLTSTTPTAEVPWFAAVVNGSGSTIADIHGGTLTTGVRVNGFTGLVANDRAMMTGSWFTLDAEL